MKYILLIVALIPNCTYAQTISRNQMRTTHEINTATDPYLENMSMEIPADFQTYSAVILASVVEETFSGKLNKLDRLVYQRMLIKIQDKASLEALSTFNLDSRYSKGSLTSLQDIKLYSIVIKKPSGETFPIDLEKITRNADNEIAIPNLEVGDVIDYGMKIAQKQTYVTCFDLRRVSLNDDYPTLNGHKRMIVSRGFFVNFKAFNGAPEMTLNATLTTRKEMVYDIVYKNLDAYTPERWAPYFRSAKNYKMQVCYFPISKAKTGPQLLGSPYELKTDATQEEKERVLKIIYKNLTTAPGDLNTIYFNRWLEKNSNKPKGDDFINTAYYYLRYHVLIYDPALNLYKEDYESRYIKEEYFAMVMLYLAKTEGIQSDIIFTTNKYFGSFDDLVTRDEFNIAFRYKSEAGDWKILYPFTSYATTDYSDERFEGQQALVYNGEEFNLITIPESSHERNINLTQFEITPELETRNVAIKSTSKTLGNLKYDYSYNILTNTGYHDDVKRAALPEGQENVMIQNRRAQRGGERTGELIKADKNEKLKSMKTMRSKSFDIDTYTSFELINSGVKSSSDSLIYQEEFTVKNVVEKVGPTYVINLSKVTIDQVSFTDKEKAERVNDIMLDFPKTYVYKYTINVPEGYTPVGVENFDANSTNEFGEVSLSASFENGKVHIHLLKAYKKSRAKKTDWPSFMEFLEPAMRMNDSKLVLKKS